MNELNRSQFEIIRRQLKYEDKRINGNDDYYKIIYLEKPSSIITLNFNEFRLDKKAIVLLSPEDFFYGKNLSGSLVAFEIKNNDNFAKFISLTFSNLLSLKEKILFSDDLHDKGEMILKLFDSINIELQDSYHIESLLYRLIIESSTTIHNIRYRSVLQFLNQVRLKSILSNYIKDHAEALNVKPKELLGELKRKGYKKPSKVISEYLMLEAKKKLVNSQLTVKEIGLELGFEDPAYFSRFFKKNSGVPANLFREKFLENNVNDA
ncbi:helix-turn-helix domain-containing protein [Aquimarina sediminis]|uniref:helix-turn-helix domain-containing protein n=1 Tax=Aquimarina sediminis TaxID=2070536 RepID=UPI000CA05852|nr:helix-turn-helix domain-containing protein [Aquimarina sediminis]